jgi:hypothetical protein
VTGSLELSLYDPHIFKEKLVHQMHEMRLNPKENEASCNNGSHALRRCLMLAQTAMMSLTSRSNDSRPSTPPLNTCSGLVGAPPH